MFKNKGMKQTNKQVVVESFNPYGGCDYGHHLKQGY
jgi:hypothetical protein